MYISDKDFRKFEYLVGFVNTVAEIVCDPDEFQDPNAKDSTVFAIGYSVDNNNSIELSTLESEGLKDFADNLEDLETEIKNAVKTDFSNKWLRIAEGD